MSAMAVASQDIAGLSASTGHKSPSAAARDADAPDDFSAALARIADAAPTDATARESAAPAAGASGKTDAALWKEFSAFSVGATDAGVEPKSGAASSPDEAGVATSNALSSAAEKNSSTPARETDSREDCRAGLPRLSVAASFVGADPPATRGTTSSRADDAVEPDDWIPAKNVEEKPSHKDAAAPGTDVPSPLPAAASDPSVSNPAPPQPGAPVLPPPAAPTLQTTAAPDGDERAGAQDAVARIGAALAGVGGAPGARASANADDWPEQHVSSDQSATVSVHVVAQKTWLPPVSAAPGLDLSLDLRPLQEDAAQAPRAVAEKTGAFGAKAALAEAPRDATAPAPTDSPSALVATASPTATSHAPVFEDDAKPAAPAAAKAAPASQTSAPAPRRDLEITLTPKDMGGLEVRMKSAGDRLELAFVTERGETARMISDKSGALTSQLHGAGLGLGGVDISAAAIAQGGGDAATSGGRQTPTQQQASGGGDFPERQSQTRSGGDRQERKDDPHDQPADSRPRSERGLYL